LLESLVRRIPEGARPWLERVEAITEIRGGDEQDIALAETMPAFDSEGLLATFTAATRRLGKAPVALDPDEQAALTAAGAACPRDGYRLDELGRVTLLAIASTRLPSPEFERLIGTCYRQGESRERQALLRALPVLSGAERFVPIAVDACRTNELPVFEAIACENPYPARWFPELGFNQMVLKAMFLGVSLARIVGLAQRRTRELARMAEGYASERRAAGRSVPADIGLVSPAPTGDGETKSDG
jgi:hypothetical protein